MSRTILMLVGDYTEDYEVRPESYDALVIAGGRAPECLRLNEIDKAITDGNLVTAPAWPAHPDWIARFLTVLGTRIVHEEPAVVSR